MRQGHSLVCQQFFESGGTAAYFRPAMQYKAGAEGKTKKEGAMADLLAGVIIFPAKLSHAGAEKNELLQDRE